MNEPRRPGDFILDRYLPNADAATRERAREAFLEFARLLEAIGEDIIAQQEADSRESEACGKIPPTLQSLL